MLTLGVFRQLRSNESGAFLVMLLIGLPAVFGAAAFMVESARRNNVASHLQVIADSSATAAAQYLNGTKKGWKSSKRAAFKIIEESTVFSVKKDLKGDVDFEHGERDDEESGSGGAGGSGNPYKGTIAIAGPLKITVERGARWKDGGSWGFESFEKSEHRGANIYGLKKYLVSNAVRVKISINSYGSLVDYLGLGDLVSVTREAVAMNDPRNDSSCVFPAAVKACDLLFNSGFGRKDDMTSNQLYPRTQCARSLQITEAEPLMDNERRDGLWRSDLYNLRYRQSIFSSRPVRNSWSLPLSGVFGVPGDGSSSEIDAVDLINAIESPCINASVGQSFSPMHKGQGFLDNSRARTALSSYFSRGDTTFREAFCSESDCSRGNADFPYKKAEIRNDKSDLILSWPIRDDFDGVMYLGDHGRMNNINPMCHDPSVGNDYDSSVRKVKLMVIAPTKEGEQYCDFKKVVQGRRPRVSNVTEDTEPKIVGFIDVSLHDFNIMKLVDPIPGDVNPAGVPVGPHNKLFTFDMTDFKKAHAEWRKDCFEDCDPCETYMSEEECKAHLRGCCSSNTPDPRSLVKVGTESGAKWLEEGFETDGVISAAPTPVVDFEHDWFIEDSEYDEAIEHYEEHAGRWLKPSKILPAKPGVRYLPIRNKGEYPVDHPSSFDGVPRHVEAGYGCGGVTGKVSCQVGQTLYGVMPFYEQRSGLVE